MNVGNKKRFYWERNCNTFARHYYISNHFILAGTALQQTEIVPLVTSSSCLVYIKSVDYPRQYWYAYHETLPILSEISKTLWTVDQNFIENRDEAVAFRVHNTSDTNAIGQFLCIFKDQLIRLCKPTDDPCKLRVRLLIGFSSRSFILPN